MSKKDLIRFSCEALQEVEIMRFSEQRKATLMVWHYHFPTPWIECRLTGQIFRSKFTYFSLIGKSSIFSSETDRHKIKRMNVFSPWLLNTHRLFKLIIIMRDNVEI